jgi:hypothetical protein
VLESVRPKVELPSPSACRVLTEAPIMQASTFFYRQSSLGNNSHKRGSRLRSLGLEGRSSRASRPAATPLPRPKVRGRRSPSELWAVAMAPRLGCPRVRRLRVAELVGLYTGMRRCPLGRRGGAGGAGGAGGEARRDGA